MTFIGLNRVARGMLAGAIFCAGTAGFAQSMKDGQRIFFSAPNQEPAATNTESLAPHSLESSGFGNPIKPSLNLNFAPQAPVIPWRPPVVISSAEAARQQQAQDRQKNWALMTPEEIMGLPTAKQIMGIPERDARGEIKHQTAEERYYERELRNENGRSNSASAYNSPNSLDNPNGSTAGPGQNNLFGNARPGNGLFAPFGNTMSTQPSADDNGGGWRPFNSGGVAPATRPVRSPEQIASAKEFEKLLQPHSSMAMRSEPANGNFSATPAHSSATVPAVSSASSPIRPMSSRVSTPIGPQPMILSSSQKETPTAPVWKPQLPPWMSQTPQLGSVPQRKF